MQLSNYKSVSEKSVAELAADFGVSEQAVYKYLSRERIPDADVMQRIYEATDGQVTANDFYDLPTTKPKSAPRAGAT